MTPGTRTVPDARPDPGTASVSTATGLSPRAAALLAYSGWWLTGALMLILEPRQPFVRAHARHAARVLGTLWLAGALLWAVGVAVAFVSPGLARAAALGAQLVWGAGVVSWGLGLWRVLRSGHA